MKKKEISGYTVLEADEGKRLLKGDNFICGTMAWLSKGDKAENYSEITEEEAKEIERNNTVEDDSETVN